MCPLSVVLEILFVSRVQTYDTSLTSFLSASRATKSSLGIYSGVDSCCRAHDHCKIKLGRFSYGFSLFNPRPYPVMHCGCDELFRYCLKMEDSGKARLVGKFYFDHLKSPCFVLKAGNVCQKRTWFGKCLERSKTFTVGEWRTPRSFFT